MKKKWLVIMPLLLVFCSCSIGLNKASKEKIAEIQQQINELNHNFKSMKEQTKALNENLKELKIVLGRLADVMESINKKAEAVLKINKLFAP